jgi:dTDP-4-amino-4,6-dideoxygalactose transaminase
MRMTEAAVGARTAVTIPFIDLQAQRRRIDDRVRRAIDAVLAHGQFIMGPEVGRLEQQLAAHCGVKHAIGCSSGTDALVLALMALGVKPGDAVFVPSFTFAATAEAVVLVGAVPVFVDCVESTFNMDAASLDAAIEAIKAQQKLRPVGAIPVDLFGQPADYGAIEVVLRKHRLWMIADAAQSFGATYKSRRVGSIGEIATTSFFPAKPLGCYGDGGAIFTNDDALAAAMRSLLFHGKGADKYDNVRIGMNGRLDTLQAAILLEKLRIFDDELVARERIAARYSDELRKVARTPAVIEGVSSVWAQYTIMVERRDRVVSELGRQGIPTAIYYPKPLHQQTAYKSFPCAPGGLPVSEKVAQYVLSLPMHPYLDAATQDRIVAAVVGALT